MAAAMSGIGTGVSSSATWLDAAYQPALAIQFQLLTTQCSTDCSRHRCNNITRPHVPGASAACVDKCLWIQLAIILFPCCATLSLQNGCAQYDLSTSTFSPDGRVFQTDYAQKAVDNSGRAHCICLLANSFFFHPAAQLHTAYDCRVAQKA